MGRPSNRVLLMATTLAALLACSSDEETPKLDTPSEPGSRLGEERRLRRERFLCRLPRGSVQGLVRLPSRSGHAGGQRRHRPGGFRRHDVHTLRRHVSLLRAGWRVLRTDRGAGRATHRVRDPLHLRRREPAAVSDRAPRRAPAGARNRLGHPAHRTGRRALVPPLPGRADRPRRSAPLDGALSGLERDVRRVPLYQPGGALRPRFRQLRHHLGRDRRLLRDLPWAGEGARRVGRGGEAAGHPRLRPPPAAGGLQDRGLALRSRRLRALPFPATPGERRGPRRSSLPGRLHAGDASRGPLPRRRTGARGGLRLRLLSPEPDVPTRGAMRRLSRSPQPAAPGAGQCALRALPQRGAGSALSDHDPQELRQARASLPSGGKAGDGVRRLSHAGDDLHGGRPAPGPQSQGAASGPLGETRHAECLQRMPRRPAGPVVGGLGGEVVRPRAPAGPPLRRGHCSGPRG